MSQRQADKSPDAQRSPLTRFATRNRVKRLVELCEHFGLLCVLFASILAVFLIFSGLNGITLWGHLDLVVFICCIFAGLAVTFYLLARMRAIGLGFLMLLLGFLLLKSPLAFALLGDRLGFSLYDPLWKVVLHALPILGFYLLIISVAHVVIANIYFLLHGRETQLQFFNPKPAEAEGQTQASRWFPNCWETYACPEAVRDKCPNFQDQMNCWKRTKGCLCDHRLASCLFESGRPVKFVLRGTGEHAALSPQEDLLTYPSRMRTDPPRKWKVQQVQCHACSIYLEHQEFKYRRLNWIFIPISLILSVFLFPYYHLAYKLGAHQLDKLSAYLTTIHALPEGIYADTTLMNSGFEYVVLPVMILLLMSYVVEFTDKCLLEWKL